MRLTKLLYAAPLSLLLASAGMVSADETVVEKKVTTTSPSGVVVIENEGQRTFKLQGQTQVYVAPPSVDLKTIRDKEVTVSVNPDGSVTKVERKVERTVQ